MVKQVLQDILNALPLIEAEHDRLDKKHGIADRGVVDLTNPIDVARGIEANQAKLDLGQKLMAHDHESLLKAAALLYYGRGDSRRFNDVLKDFRVRNVTADQIVGMVLEKQGVIQGYVEVARRKLETEGLTIDTI